MADIDRDNEKLNEQLSAYLDDELTEAQRAEVERLVESDPAVARRLETLRRTVELVGSLPRRSAPPELLAEVTATGRGAGAPASCERVGPVELSVPTRRLRVFSALAAAALVTISVGAGLWALLRVTQQTSPHGAKQTVAVAPQKKELLERGARRGGAEPGRPQSKVERSVTGPAELAEGAAAPTARSDETPPLAMRREKEGRLKDSRLGESAADGVDHTAPGLEKSVAFAADAKEQIAAARDAISEQNAVGDRIVRRATIEQKLMAGVAVGDLRHHYFEAEDVQLQVAFAAEADRDAALARLADFLRERGVPELRSYEALDLFGVAPPVTGETDFFVRGRSPQNYSDARERQILVRVEREQLQPLLDAVAGAAAPADVGLTVGPLDVHGIADADRLLALANPVSGAAPYGQSATAEGFLEAPAATRAVSPVFTAESLDAAAPQERCEPSMASRKQSQESSEFQPRPARVPSDKRAEKDQAATEPALRVAGESGAGEKPASVARGGYAGRDFGGAKIPRDAASSGQVSPATPPGRQPVTRPASEQVGRRVTLVVRLIAPVAARAEAEPDGEQEPSTQTHPIETDGDHGDAVSSNGAKQ